MCSCLRAVLTDHQPGEIGAKNGRRGRRSMRRRRQTHIWHFISCRVMARARRRSLTGGPVDENKSGRYGVEQEEGQQTRGGKQSFSSRKQQLRSLESREGETLPSVKAHLKGLIGRNSSLRGRCRVNPSWPVVTTPPGLRDIRSNLGKEHPNRRKVNHGHHYLTLSQLDTCPQVLQVKFVFCVEFVCFYLYLV